MVSIASPRTAQQAIASANRYERAQRLIVEGYTFHSDALTDSVAVCKPGRLAASYWIVEGDCDCPDAMQGNECKHMMAWKLVQAEQADELEGLEAQCREWDEQEGWADMGAYRLRKMRDLLLSELLASENTAARLNADPKGKKSAVRSWAEKAHRCKVAVQQFDETLAKIAVGLLTL